MIGRVIVVLNVGNTNVGYGIVASGRLAATGRSAAPSADAGYRLEMILDEILSRAGTGASEPVELVVASVVPSLTVALHELAARRGVRLLIADETTVPIPMSVESPGTAGHDRLVNAYAAARLHGAPAIVVDLGTATTFDVVNAAGTFVGGAIAPGIGLGLDALATRTAQLPRVPLALPPRAIGANTVEAIQSGAVLGHVGLVGHLLRAMTGELETDGGPQPRVVLTGGLAAHPWAAAIQGVDAIDPLLTLRGLALLRSEVARLESVPSA